MAGELVNANTFLKIGQRLEISLDDYTDGNISYTSRIEDIVGDELIVAMPHTGKRVPVIPRQGETLYVLAAGDGCHYRFFSTHNGTGYTNQKDKRIPVLYISAPEVGERFQKRRSFRVRVNAGVTVRLVDKSGKIYPPAKARIINFSGTGLAFAWHKELEIGSEAGLEINDIPKLGALSVMSTVVRCLRIDREDEPAVYHIGVKFEALSKPAVEKIIRYLFEVQRKDLKGIVDDD